MESQMFEGQQGERTFEHQDSLPALPVPSLDETLTKYLDSVRPFATDEELAHTREVARRFKEGVGAKLHALLLRRGAERQNWLEEWWLNKAYLESRGPQQITGNFGGPGPYLEHVWPPKAGTQLERAAILLWHHLNFWQLLRTERLATHRAKGVPLDMHQFRMIFGTCKIPGEKCDSIVCHFKTEAEGACPSHVVVLCHGRIFTFDSLAPGGDILTPPELQSQLALVKARCAAEPEGPGLSVLTAGDRASWAKTRQHLLNLCAENVEHMNAVESSLLVLVLEQASPSASPSDYSQLQSWALAGNPRGRWGDKSYNLIVFENGTCVSNCDHAPYDAMVLVSTTSYAENTLKRDDGVWVGEVPLRPLPQPQELRFRLDERILSDIAHSEALYNRQAKDLQVVSLAFTAFGKLLIKQRGLHPDTYVQLALQLAYYRLHGRPGCCYETASTRKFYHGRTETMRPCTPEAVAWCRAMQEPSMPTGRRLELMLEAFDKHNRLMKECENNKGCDRHLLGLLLLAEDEGLPVPELFRDPSFTKSGGGGNFVLSTSLVGYTNTLGAVAPMVPHGYGFFYRIRDDRLVVSVTAWRSCPQTDGERLYHAFAAALHEMQCLALTRAARL
ncbi:peroxisomal carnitine O-octanoyltransferase isoform X1 [Lampetra fluviatilis]